MASATQVPPSAPPARPPRPPRSLAGPVVLIVIGIFFLLGNLHILYWHDLGRWFAHYWPVLLIIWGIIKLIEYQQANRTGTRPAGIGAGGVLLVIFLVVAGLIATSASNFDWGQIRDQMHIEGADIPWWGHTYDYNADLQQNFPPGATLRVTSIRGAINVTTSNDNRLHVTAHKRINAENEQDAAKWDKLTQPQINVSGQTVTINANTQGAGDHWVSSDLDIALPRKASVVASTNHGDVSIMGRDGNADVNSENGAVEVHINKLGGVEIKNSKGDIRIFVPAKAGFQLQAQVHDGEIQSDFNDLKVDNGENRSSAAGSVNGGGPRINIENEHGTIEVRKGTVVPVPAGGSNKASKPEPPEPPEPTEN